MPAVPSVLRARPGRLGQAALSLGMAALPPAFRLLRAVHPVARLGNTYLVTRHDDVRQVFADDRAFATPYRAKLDVILGGQPFVLGLPDGPHYRQDLAALHQVLRASDIDALAARVEAMASDIVAASPGQVDVVDLVRRVAFGFFAEYLSLPEPEGGDLMTWGMRLFEYQFVADDTPLREEVARIAPALRDHVDRTILHRRANPDGRDDVLARCLTLQADHGGRYDDVWIRTALIGMIVGGPPQPPMVVPQAFEQLLRRPNALASAQVAARHGDDRLLAAHLMEAMRFDPLAPWMPRVAIAPRTLGKGPGARRIPAGAKVLASVASAMRDSRRVPDPDRFDATRTDDQYLHFGWGVHQCFGLEINRATLHRMVKPLLIRPNLRRAEGRASRLVKQGAFARSLVVAFD